jgi:uncharacterized protein
MRVTVGLVNQRCCCLSLGGSDDMKPPLITATYVAILAVLYTVLTLQVVRLRRRNRVGFGDGENAALRCAIGAPAHFAEYVR